MPRQGRRRLIDPRVPNCYEDASGRSISVKVFGQSHERRFPKSTPLPELEREVEELRRTARKKSVRPPRYGTLDADVVAYLQTIAGERKRRDAATLLSHWAATYGHESRWSLTPVVIRQQMATWRRQGVAASTCNKRMMALRALFRTLNEPDEPNPVADIDKLEEPASIGYALDYELLARILDGMPDRGRPERGQRLKDGTLNTLNLAKARLTFMAYTSLPHEQLKQINPRTDIDWTLPAVKSHARRKGKGAKGVWIPLLPPAAAALRVLVDAKALTRFSNSPLWKAWQRACVRVIREQLANREDNVIPHRIEEDGAIVALVRPYDVRHSFATVALNRSGNLAGAQSFLQHSKPEMTLRYADAAIAPATAQVAEALKDLPAPRWIQQVKAKVLAPRKKLSIKSA